MSMLADFEEVEAPELGEWVYQPHDFQYEAFRRTVQAFEDERCPSALIVCPTGGGKTFVFMMLARWVVEDHAGRVLVLAHTGELIEQAVKQARYVGLTAARESGDDHARPDFTRPQGPSWFGDSPPDPKLVVGMVQSLKGDRLRAWPPGHFDMIVIDECHHSVATSYQAIVDHFQPRWLLGVTATADRGDGKPIVGQNQMFERLTHEVYLHDLVRLGFLKRPVAKVLDTTIDLKKLRVKGAKDYNDQQLEELLLPHVAEIVNELRDKLSGHRAVIFTPMVCSAEAVASGLSSVGVSTVAVSGDDPARVSKLHEFRKGHYQHVACSALLTEGWDEPFVDSAVILRPTKLRGLFVQMAGRCLRQFPGKPEGYIWGVNWQTHRHELVHPVEIFDAPGLNINRETVAGAKALIDSGEESDIASALKRAQSERKERRKVELQVKERAARAPVYTFDLLGGPVSSAADTAAPLMRHERAATENQVNALVRKGVDERSARAWSFRKASGFLGEQAQRREKGLCTYKQQKLLRKLGFPGSVASLGFAEASAAIDGLMAGR